MKHQYTMDQHSTHLSSSASWLCIRQGPTQSNPTHCTRPALLIRTAQAGHSCHFLQDGEYAMLTSRVTTQPCSAHTKYIQCTCGGRCQWSAECKAEQALIRGVGSTATTWGHCQRPGRLIARTLGSCRGRDMSVIVRV